MQTKATWQKLQFFKNLRWRMATMLKIIKSPYLSEQELSYRKQIACQLHTQYVESILR